jgi:dihydrofolate synthase/folylpolyglutamate synthase
VQYNGKPIDKELFSQCVEIIKPEIEKMSEDGAQITEFEALTATAFLCFSKLNVDVLVLEVGLGGRLDATNVIDTPLVNVITSLSLDHTGVLGDAIEKIAFEKCGTIKENGTLVCAYNQPESAMNVIKTICNERNNVLIIPEQSEIEITKQSIFGMHFIYKKQAYQTSMSGTHQVQNMTTVIEAVNVLKNKGYNITEQNIKDGIKKTVLPARVEVISKNPLVILDGGHNEDGAKAFYNAVKECFDSNKKLFVIAGMMNDKAVEDSLKPLISKADTFVAVTPENPRAMKAEALGEIAKKYCHNCLVCDNANSSIDLIKNQLTEDDMLFVVGSLYLAGEVRTKLLAEFKNVD